MIFNSLTSNGGVCRCYVWDNRGRSETQHFEDHCLSVNHLGFVVHFRCLIPADFFVDLQENKLFSNGLTRENK